MAIVRLILLLGICVTGFITIECVDCSNGAGYCNYGSSYIHCYITSNDTQLIKALLSGCSSNSSSFTYIFVYKNYVSNEYGNIIINIELPSNIWYLYIYNYRDQDHIRLTTSSQNTGLRRIYAHSSYIELESNDFFTHFTGLQYIYMNYVLSREPPSFTNLNYLTNIRISLVGPVSHVLDEGVFNGSINLRSLSLSNSYFNGITKGAFRNLNSLTSLRLENNELTYIEEGALSNLKRLYLIGNKKLSISDNFFEDLTYLSDLSLDDYPGFPLNTLIQAKSVYYLYLRYNGYQTLDPYVFQQMNSLRYLYLTDPFVCDCKLQWTSLVEQFGLYIRSAVCLETSDHFARTTSITDQISYSNCSQTESFQCFSNSITCPNNQVCHNTENSYFCGCPIGYAEGNSSQCDDIDECNGTANCQHTCVNTEGSFHCACNVGYTLGDDGYSCDDINECQVLNGGCELGCRNTIGSYQCYCYNDHELTNKANCDNEVKYIVVQDIDSVDYNFVCYGNKNLISTDITCENIPPQTTDCLIGYVQRYTGECVDEDECDFYTNCQHSCVNTEGSFHCECNGGYQLVDDGYSCDDINECHEVNGCEFGCSNTIGSYQCYCSYGYGLKNETHCDNEIQCTVVQNIENEYYRFFCAGNYTLMITNFTCEDIPRTTIATTSSSTTTIPATVTTTMPSGCPIGYLERYTGECVDEDECAFYTDCQHSCVNTEGSFHCECNVGYKLADDGNSCDDINECHESNGGCEFGCSNSIGSYQCYCSYGYGLKNETHCDNEILCIVVENIADEDYRFSCVGNYNLTITNFTFDSGDLASNSSTDDSMVQNIENPSCVPSGEQIPISTIIMFILLIIIISIQTIIIILILLWSLRKIKKAKNPKIHCNTYRKHFQENSIEIPLEDIIENQHSTPPETIMQNPDDPEDPEENAIYANIK